MSLKVSISTASAFLAIVAKKTLAKVRHLEIVGDHRDAAAALRALGVAGLAIVDAELLRDPSAGAALTRGIASRRGPTIVLDARGEGAPAELSQSPTVAVLHGRRKGELDLGVIESDLAPAVAGARRHLRDVLRSEPIPPLPSAEPYEGPLELIVLGVSTGGPTLLLALLAALDAPTVPLLTVQHMPESETPGFAARLAEESGHRVVEVSTGPLPAAGAIGVVRGGSDVRLVRRGDGALALRRASLEGNPFHPNIDEVLLSAVAASVAVGAAILTGMGKDGAAGALAMSRKGLPVIAQRPDTCAVAGMPQAVIDAGAARWVQPPEGIARTLNRWFAAAAHGRPRAPKDDS
jgi:two-component system chemotaxis response regulator CheB